MSTFTETEGECRYTGFDPGFETQAVRLAPATSAANVMYFKKPKLSDLDKLSAAAAAAASARSSRIDQPENITRKLESALHVYGVSAAAFKHATKMSPMAHFPLPSEDFAPREPLCKWLVIALTCLTCLTRLTRLTYLTHLTSSYDCLWAHAHARLPSEAYWENTGTSIEEVWDDDSQEWHHRLWDPWEAAQ